jgi:hypothetical protein
MKDAATAIPSASDGAVGRSNNDCRRARIGGGPTCVSEVPAAALTHGMDDNQPGNGDRFCVIAQAHIDRRSLREAAIGIITGNVPDQIRRTRHLDPHSGPLTVTRAIPSREVNPSSRRRRHAALLHG